MCLYFLYNFYLKHFSFLTRIETNSAIGAITPSVFGFRKKDKISVHRNEYRLYDVNVLADITGHHMSITWC
jgi:hypothetical protein